MATEAKTEAVAAGETGFLEDGSEVLVLAVVDSGFVVENRMCSEDGEADFGYGLRFYAPKVYRTPPVAKLDAQFAAKIDELEAARAELRAVRNEVATATAERKALLETLKQVPALKYLDEYIAGRITHFVEVRYGHVTIRERNTEKFDPYDNRKGEKLLCLFGKSGSDLSWKINDYRDGSGSWNEVHPCRSLEEAHAKAREVLGTRVSLVRAGQESIHVLSTDSFTAAANACGYVLPDDMAKKLDDAVREGLTKSVEAAREALAKAEAALRKAGGAA